MKQKLLKTMLLLCTLLVGGVSNAWADDQTLFDVTTASNWETSNSTYNSTVWSSNGCIFVQAANNNKSWAYVRIGGKSLTNVNAYIATTTATTIKTKQLDVTVAQAKSNSNLTINSVTLYVYGSYNSSTKTYSDEVESISYDVKDYAAGTMTFEPSDDDYWEIGVYFKLVYNLSNSKTSNYGTDVSKLVAKEYTSGGGTPTVVTPTFDPIAGTYTTAKNVGIDCGTDGATIHYTMTEDGTTPDDPTESDAVYSSKISVTKSGTQIKAKAFKADMTASSVASASYTIKPNKPTISAAGATVTISGDDGLTFYYTTDGSAPTNSSTEYTAPFDLAEDCTIKAKAYDTYGNASDATSDFTFKYMPLSPKNIGSGYYEKVTSVSSLENGDAILIVNETANVALSTTQNSNNRGQQGVTITTGTPNVIYAPSAKAQKLVLVKKTEKIDDKDTDVFYFYTGSGYLYAAGANSNNYMRTETTPDANNNARATISISSGDATITFKGSASRNLLQYNSGSKIFSCYGSAQQNVQIYKEVAHNESVTVTSAGYATIASPYALDFTDSDIEAYIATSSSGSAVTLSSVNKVPANTGILLKYTGGTTENIPVFDGTGADDVSENLLAVSNGSVTGGAGIYALANKSHGVGFYLVSDKLTIASGKVYLDLSGGAVKEFLDFDFGGDNETAIESLTPALSEDKGYVYDLSGRRVQKPTKGLYIVNGKKVMF